MSASKKTRLWVAGLFIIAVGIIMVRIISPRLHEPVPVLTAYFGGLVTATVGLLIVILAIRSKS